MPPPPKPPEPRPPKPPEPLPLIPSVSQVYLPNSSGHFDTPVSPRLFPQPQLQAEQVQGPQHSLTVEPSPGQLEGLFLPGLFLQPQLQVKQELEPQHISTVGLPPGQLEVASPSRPFSQPRLRAKQGQEPQYTSTDGLSQGQLKAPVPSRPSSQAQLQSEQEREAPHTATGGWKTVPPRVSLQPQLPVKHDQELQHTSTAQLPKAPGLPKATVQRSFWQPRRVMRVTLKAAGPPVPAPQQYKPASVPALQRSLVRPHQRPKQVLQHMLTGRTPQQAFLSNAQHKRELQHASTVAATKGRCSQAPLQHLHRKTTKEALRRKQKATAEQEARRRKLKSMAVQDRQRFAQASTDSSSSSSGFGKELKKNYATRCLSQNSIGEMVQGWWYDVDQTPKAAVLKVEPSVLGRADTSKAGAAAKPLDREALWQVIQDGGITRPKGQDYDDAVGRISVQQEAEVAAERSGKERERVQDVEDPGMAGTTEADTAHGEAFATGSQSCDMFTEKPSSKQNDRDWTDWHDSSSWPRTDSHNDLRLASLPLLPSPPQTRGRNKGSWYWQNANDNGLAYNWHWNNRWSGERIRETAQSGTKGVGETEAGTDTTAVCSAPFQVLAPVRPKRPVFLPPMDTSTADEHHESNLQGAVMSQGIRVRSRSPRRNRSSRFRSRSSRSCCDEPAPEPNAQQKVDPVAEKHDEPRGSFISRLLYSETTDGGVGDERCAFVIVVFGTNPAYCLEAAVLGLSLRKRTRHHMVLMHTDDVPKVWLEVCEHVGWVTRRIEHVVYHKSLYPRGRFNNVFTKLRVLGLEEFPKVVLLDTDMLVRTDSIDSIFVKPAPSAVRRHATGKYEDGDEIVPDQLFKRGGGDQIGGINAGFVLLKPDERDLVRMEVQLRTGQVIGKIPFKHGPEQDFLTRFYAGDSLKSLGIEWNYQLHQIAYCSRFGHVDSRRMTFSYQDVNVVHFSGPISLTKWVLDAEHDGQSFHEFAKTTILQSYLDLLDKDPKRGAKAARSSVKARLRDVTTVATQEWYEMYQQLLVDLPTISSLIEKERYKEEEEGDGSTRKSASRTQAKNTRKHTSAAQR